MEGPKFPCHLFHTLQTVTNGAAMEAVLSQETDGCHQPVVYVSRVKHSRKKEASSTYEFKYLAMSGTDNF
jgi:hypothetical protein